MRMLSSTLPLKNKLLPAPTVTLPVNSAGRNGLWSFPLGGKKLLLVKRFLCPDVIDGLANEVVVGPDTVVDPYVPGVHHSSTPPPVCPTMVGVPDDSIGWNGAEPDVEPAIEGAFTLPGELPPAPPLKSQVPPELQNAFPFGLLPVTGLETVNV